MSTTLIEAPRLPLPRSTRPAAPFHQFRSWPTGTVPWHLIGQWGRRRAQRNTLRDLAADDHLLADIGLTRAQALREAAKPFWQR